MTRHITDRPHRKSDSSRLVQYLSQDRSNGRSRVWTKMDRERQSPKGLSRIKQFLRIDRGIST
ncbi:hypothetical protein [Celeribacter sp. PS-C1]|uniref:hypothetical protein n=1 Tax=Celeribacter sp. PS-C1 TaxID=2820813 RepID=UPI001CA51DDD|nr:hypothetical protein [Celeribacter sp. PS-C1]MBW6418650.1 hypothetical protein [Celeribacter sp. PS-C1]